MGKVAEFTETAAGELRFISLLLGHHPMGSVSHYPVRGSVRQNQVTVRVFRGVLREMHLSVSLHHRFMGLSSCGRQCAYAVLCGSACPDDFNSRGTGPPPEEKKPEGIAVVVVEKSTLVARGRR